MAAHMAARAAAASPPPGAAVMERETVELGGSINSNSVAFNAAIMEEEVYVESELPVGDSFNPRMNEELIPPLNATLTPNSNLVQNLKSAIPNKVVLNDVTGNPIISEIKDGISHFNANLIPSSSCQLTALTKEKTLAAPSQGTMLNNLDDQDEV
nr:hypothetical protein CFP56_08867 [Quercus suber]